MSFNEPLSCWCRANRTAASSAPPLWSRSTPARQPMAHQPPAHALKISPSLPGLFDRHSSPFTLSFYQEHIVVQHGRKVV